MPSDIDFPGRSGLLLSLAFACAAAGCAQPRAPEAAAAPQATAAVPASPVYIAVPVASANPVEPLLAYADKVRNLPAAELSQEITRLNEQAAPADQLRLALALVQTRQLYDLARAQELLQKVLAAGDAEARRLHPLARLLAARFAEQRRVEDLLDRQSQQLREAQRKVDQSNDKLEALKEIERSLTSRPANGTAPSSPRGRSSRPSAP